MPVHRSIIRRRARGQAAVLAALCFIVLVGFLGLAIDGSNAFGQRRRLANATDAAAMAGTRALVAAFNNSGTGFRNNSGTRAYNAIEEFLTSRHELSDGTVSWRATWPSEPSGLSRST
jgi:Flp pilus assembly protein TadG